MYPQTKKMKMVAASICRPKKKPNHPKSGQDAHFIAAKEQCIGVADGVGSWLKDGIDSGIYAKQLMHNCVESLKNGNKKRPRQVLEEAYSKTTALGSSTACIVSFSGGKVLRAANVGDSGFLVIRKGRVKYRSPTQQHRFNCPFQLGTKGDDPSVAQGIKVVGLTKGDLVLLATDGVLDNVRESEMLEIVANKQLDLKELCRNIANVARNNSLDRNTTDTPYSIAARRAGKYRPGGKEDDITLVVARIQEEAARKRRRRQQEYPSSSSSSLLQVPPGYCKGRISSFLLGLGAIFMLVTAAWSVGEGGSS